MRPRSWVLVEGGSRYGDECARARAYRQALLFELSESLCVFICLRVLFGKEVVVARRSSGWV